MAKRKVRRTEKPQTWDELVQQVQRLEAKVRRLERAQAPPGRKATVKDTP